MLPRKIDQTPSKNGTPPTSFEADVAQLDSLMVRFAEARGGGLLPHNRWGNMSRGMWGRYGYRHVNHHLRQFGLEPPLRAPPSLSPVDR